MLTKEDKKYIDENWLYRTEHELAKELNSTKWYIVKYKEEQQYTGEKKTEFRYNFIRDNKYMTNRQLAKALNVTGATIGSYKDKIYKGREKIEKKEVVDIEIDPMPLKMIPYKLQGNYISKEDISKIKAKEGGFYKVKETDNKNNDSYSNRGVWECVKNYKDFILFKKNGIRESFLKIDIKTNTIKLEVLR